MDTYIKMCEKAIEIQKFAPKIPEVKSGREKWNEIFIEVQGSMFWLPKDNEFALLHWDNDEGSYIIGGYFSHLEGMIWLPRQDQLQEIYLHSRKHKINCGQMSMIFEDWRINELMRYGKDLINWSMEQLWLAFVMKEKYNKVWDSEDWRNR